MKTILTTILVINILFFGTIISSQAKETATKDSCIQHCQRAVKLAKTKGTKAMIDAINNSSTEFVWLDTYVFAINYKLGTVIAHPMKPKLIGKQLAGVKDINSKMFFVEFMRAAKQGSGWIDYMWPKPNSKVPVAKTSYVLKVPNSNIAVIAGVYK